MLKKLVFFTSLFFSISALAISTPSYVSVSMNGTTVTLDWGTVSGASYYQLQYRDGYGSWGTSGGSYYGGTHNWTGFTGTLQNRNYRMRACDSNNVCSSWSSASNWISTPLPIPDTPSYVSVSMNNDGSSAYLSWGTVSGASYYELQYRDGYGSWGTSGGSYYNGSHTWNNVTETLSNRNYRMRACNSEHGCSSWSSASNWISTPLPVPASPSYVSVSINPTKVSLSWQEVSGASYYQLQYRDGSGSWGTSNLSYYDGLHVWHNPTEILNERNYRMRSCNSENSCSSWSSASNRISTPKPNTPNKPVAVVNGKDIAVEWNEVEWATEYKIQVQWSHAEFAGIEDYESITNSISWQDTYPGSRIYKIQACNAVGCSSLSAPSEQVHLASVPARPAKPQASATGNKIQVSWNAVYGATYYDLSIKYGLNDWTVPGRYEYQGTSISWPDLEVGTRLYRVKACNSAGCSDYSDTSLPLKNFVDTPRANRVGEHGIELLWDTSLKGKFDIQIKFNHNEWTEPGRFTSNEKGINWDNVPSGERSYRIRSCDDSLTNCSEWSAESNKVSIPLWIHDVQVDGSSTRLEWGPIIGANYYDISIKYNNNDWTVPGRFTSSAHYIAWDNVEAGVRSYKIRSCTGVIGNAVCSGWSEPTKDYTTVGLPSSTPALKVTAIERTFINESERITWQFASPPSTSLTTTLFVIKPGSSDMIELASVSNSGVGVHDFVFDQSGRYRFFAQACGTFNSTQVMCSERWSTEKQVEVLSSEFTPEQTKTELTWQQIAGAKNYIIETASCANHCDMSALDWSTLKTLNSSQLQFAIPGEDGRYYRIKVCFSDGVCTSGSYVAKGKPKKQIIYIHTDLLGSPVAESQNQ
ncbi:hypothetical protein L1D59_15605 [Pseudoalteromonas piscicida]|uniref:hypothetical protein n=1 Tax=Pseudoalteromonas piscicida TaxID=43662 RepID=UPI001EFE97FC|nr:hypothetical protein [Pseudoalteromonas piscicida]MCG9770026.1 hypothetical protein [Pseudoalteromonas piscicida]